MQNNIESKWEEGRVLLKVALQIGHIYKHQTFFTFGGLVTKLCPTLGAPWTVAHHAPLSMGFSRQEYWSWLPFPSPGDLPDPGIKFGSPTLQADSLLTALWGNPAKLNVVHLNTGTDGFVFTNFVVSFDFFKI